VDLALSALCYCIGFAAICAGVALLIHENSAARSARRYVLRIPAHLAKIEHVEKTLAMCQRAKIDVIVVTYGAKFGPANLSWPPLPPANPEAQ
jgi:hypothetical protein